MAADRAPLHGRILAQVALVGLSAGLSEPVHPQLALAGEVALAGGTLEAGVREMQTKVLLKVRAHLEAAATLGAGVGAINVLRSLCEVLWWTRKR